ncbi:MAG TPA: tetratricopeptide repeat protein [Saprospiraceae bacterium]|nr:tetratricopeptide repeat protein [Saprospiraceae bacterium]
MVRSFFLNIFLLLATNLLFGQTIPPQAPNKIVDGKKEGEWVVWYDKEWKKTDIQDSVAYYRKINYVGSKPDGMVYDFYRSGVIKREGELLEDFPKNIPQGLCYIYYETGKIKSKFYVKNGILHGCYEEYDENGILEKECEYEDGWLIGESMPNARENNLIKETHIDSTENLIKIANNFYNSGKINEAIQYYKKYSNAIEIEFGKYSESYLTTLNNLGELYSNINQYDIAILFHLEAIDIKEKTMGKNSETYGTSLSNLARLYSTIGDYQLSLAYFLKALEVKEKTVGINSISYGITLNNLGELYLNIGYYELALNKFFGALEIVEKKIGKENSEYGTILNNLAVLYMELRQYDKALLTLEEALYNAKKFLGINHLSYTNRLYNLAELLEKKEDYANSFLLFKKALQITENNLGKNHVTYNIRLNRLARFYILLKQFEKAKSICSEALINIEKVHGKDHYLYIMVLSDLANVYEGIEEYDKAIKIFLEVKEKFKESLGENHSQYGVCLNNLSALYKAMGQYEKALPLYLEAKENIEKNLASNFTFMDEKSKENYLKTISDNFQNFNSFYLKYYHEYPSMRRHILDNELLMKSLILQSSSNINNFINNSKDTIIVHKGQELIALKNIIIKEDTKSLNDRRKDLPDMVEKAERLEGELTRLSSQFAEFQSIGKIKTKDVAKVLKANEVAIEFASFRYHNDKIWTDSMMYVALILRPQDSVPVMVPLFEEKELDGLLSEENIRKEDYVKKMYNLKDRKSTPIESKTSRNLYDLIWKPIEPYLKEGNTVYYALSGKLSKINHNAIPVNATTCMLDKYKLVSLQSTRELVSSSQKKYNPATSILYGGLTFSAQNKSITFNEPSTTRGFAFVELDSTYSAQTFFDEIEHSDVEVEQIATLFDKHKMKYVLKKGEGGTEDFFNLQCKQTPSPRVLHLATHGYFFPEIKTSKKDLEKNEVVFQGSKQAMIRSGLILSQGGDGFNGKIAKDNEEDGVLTALEISNLNLSNTELVVLSACDTGLGDIKGSEGVYGLQRAFKMAGVKYLIMSLWQVPDKQTSKLMILFYQNWLDHEMSIPDAFAAAQKKMKDDGFDPYQWAGFVLIQ